MIGALAGAWRWHWRLPAVRLRTTAPFEALIALSWIVLVWSGAAASGPAAGSLSTSGSASMPGMAPLLCVLASARIPAGHAAIAWLPMWAVMTIAMMLPTALPALSYVAAHSYRWRRHRAMSQFAGTYLMIWLAFGATVLLLIDLARPDSQRALELSLLVACCWQLTPHKRRAMRDSHRSVPLAPSGWTATAGITRFGLVSGGASLRACWPLMLTMVAAPASTMLLWMPLLTGLMLAEKLSRRPILASRIVAGLLASGLIVTTAVG